MRCTLASTLDAKAEAIWLFALIQHMAESRAGLFDLFLCGCCVMLWVVRKGKTHGGWDRTLQPVGSAIPSDQLGTGHVGHAMPRLNPSGLPTFWHKVSGVR